MELKSDYLSPEIKAITLRDEVTVEDLVSEISFNLNEPNKTLINKIIHELGKEKTIQFYNETRIVENNGGLYYQNGERRKTPGGVFFYLVYHDKTLPSETIKKIFQDEVRKTEKHRKAEAKLRRIKQNEELKQRLIKEGLLNIVAKK